VKRIFTIQSFILLAILFAGTSIAFIIPAKRNNLPSSDWLEALPRKGLLRNGDLVFRHATGAFSDMLVQFSLKDPRYSHAGILSIEGDSIFVYHAMGGEATSQSTIRKSTLKDFCHPEEVLEFGIYRTDLDASGISKIVQLAKEGYKSHIPFDSGFDLSSDSAVYCTEFVYRIILSASGDKNYIAASSINGFKYVACDNLYINKHAVMIYTHRYPD
jgi:hypothetical protein